MNMTVADPVGSQVSTATEVLRFFSTGDRALVSIRSDGTVWLLRAFASEWAHKATKKPEIDMNDWLEKKRDVAASQPHWARNIDALPSRDELEEWGNDCVCETPTGHTVEPDGTGPDGVPSWLRVLGLI